MTGGTADVAQISPARRREIVDALRRGRSPARHSTCSLGIGHLAPTFDSELGVVASGGAGFKAIRGEYGAGKTFVTRWLAERARQRGFATAEVQISEGETPLHHLQTVYRRAVERLATPDQPTAALRSVIDGWFFAHEEEVLAGGQVDERDEAGLLNATGALAERRLADVATRAPAFGAVLRSYPRAVATGDHATAEGLIAWLGGQPHVAAGVKRASGRRRVVEVVPARDSAGRPHWLGAGPGQSLAWRRRPARPLRGWIPPGSPSASERRSDSRPP